jgi:hypothetical protein
MRKATLIALAWVFCLSTGHAQNIPTQRLLVLIAGPSGDRISANEQAVVSYMNQLRGEYELYDLQMGTMHFDRPREAGILKNKLGFSPDSGVTVGLVQLSEQGIPSKTLYKAENVTQASLQREHLQLLKRWSELSAQPLPAALQSQETASRPPTNPDRTSPPLNPPARVEVYTFEGIRTVVNSLQQQTSDLWLDFRNQPSRDDRLDVPVREATLDLLEATTNLKAANQNGIIFPLAELEAVRAAGRDWKLTEPQFYLPPHLRTNVEPIVDLIDKVEAIEYQGRKG